MPSDPLVLAFDTSGPHVCATLIRGDTVRAQRAEEMAKGQAERLVPLLEEVLADGAATWSDLDRIGVGVGPGNFTGIRISVACARGLALGLGIPAIGVDSFDAISEVTTIACAPFVPAPRGQGFVKLPGASEPKLLSAKDLADLAQDLALQPPDPDTLALGIARLAARRRPDGAPKPLYARPADAAPARDAPPVILDA